MNVKSGLDVLVAEDFARLKGLKVGLVAHPASVDARLRHVLELMHGAGVNIQTVFGPEHGVLGDAQDMEIVEEATDAIEPLTGARLFSLYGTTVESLKPTKAMLEGLDVVVVDMQDVGARYYTYAATMGYVLQVAAGSGVRVMVLDRPNPLGGRAVDIEGPPIEPKFHSFVGAFNMAIRHGLTIGEYGRYVRSQLGLDVELDVVAMDGWSREMDFEATGLPWVMPSPNMPTLDAAWIYPGMCLFEGTNLSEGRGTTRPFELSGAPYIDARRWARDIGEHPGVILRPTWFTPTFQKHGKVRCGGVQIHVTDRSAVRSLKLAVAMLVAARAQAPDDFEWRSEVYEYVSDRLAIDLLFGSAGPREAIEAGASADDICGEFIAAELAFVEERSNSLLYRTAAPSS